MRTLLSLIFIGFLSAWRPAPLPTELSAPLLYWTQSSQLDWGNFKGKPLKASSVDAVTSCGIMCTPAIDSRGILTFEIHCYFSKKDSWVKKDGKTKDLLRHEQGHFDIGEIYARKLRRRVTHMTFDRRKLDRQIQKVYDEVFEEYRIAQSNYDEESDHSRNSRMQAAWERWINYQLTQYRDYAQVNVRNVPANS